MFKILNIKRPLKDGEMNETRDVGDEWMFLKISLLERYNETLHLQSKICY